MKIEKFFVYKNAFKLIKAGYYRKDILNVLEKMDR